MSNWKEELWRSVKKNDLTNFSRILSQDFVKPELPNVTYWKSGECPIHLAVAKGRESMLLELLENGANPNALLVFESESNVPLVLWAVYNSQIYSVELLIRFGADQTLEAEIKNGKLLF